MQGTLLLEKRETATASADVRRIAYAEIAAMVGHFHLCPYHSDHYGDLFLGANRVFACLGCHARGTYSLLQERQS